jgi:hypothetical protein
MTEVTAELRRWWVDNIGGQIVIHGQIHEDTRRRWPDGHEIRTSSVKSIDMEAGIAVTRNSTYRLAGARP